MEKHKVLLNKALVIGIFILLIGMSVVSSARYNATVSNPSIINFKMASPNILLYENFSGTFPPEGWSTDCWTQSNISCCGTEPPCAYLSPYNPSEYDGYITSKAIDTSDYEIVHLSFAIAIWTHQCSFYFAFRMNETSPWKVIAPWANPLFEDVFSQIEYKINCSSGGNCGDALQIKWTVTSIYDWGWDACIDDVCILGGDYSPPESPTIDGPTSGKPGIDYNYTFASCDPEGDDVYYFIDWGDETFEEWIGPYPSCQIVEISHEWPEPGVYYITAQAADIYGGFSDWSDPYEVIIGNEPPNAPTIIGQTSGKAGKKYEYTFNATDPEGNDLKYFIDWGDNTTNETDFNASATEFIVKHAWNEDGAYNITAKAQDIYGLKGPEGTLTVTIPKSRTVSSPFPLLLRLFERFPLLERLMSLIKVM